MRRFVRSGAWSDVWDLWTVNRWKGKLKLLHQRKVIWAECVNRKKVICATQDGDVLTISAVEP